MSKKFLDKAYGLDSAEATREFYADWAASYESEVEEHGYASPLRTAAALKSIGSPASSPLLDIGCGTGLSGLALASQGFSNLHGSDFSPPMLEKARAKGIYGELFLADLNAPLDYIKTEYRLITAIGVFSPGHAGPEFMAKIMEFLPQGGVFGFSLNDHALDEPGYLDEVSRLVMERKARIRWQEYGDHLPKIDLCSLIMVVEKL